MPHGQEYNSPKDIPLIERCAKRASQQSEQMSKGDAIAACTKRAKQAGRIKKKENGKWVVVKQRQRRGQRQQQGGQRRAR